MQAVKSAVFLHYKNLPLDMLFKADNFIAAPRGLVKYLLLVKHLEEVGFPVG